ncbi:DNA topoisomerase I [Amphritea sp. 1_MG-2023]|uniref:DNA topoisomerase I n=1 Tax=Amphritea sp. 1_MG-2023 TaxID=3062670 RepID=UPI0026E40365|nr:DNA topoisomerase I [Amphritea sp. 1_MG-2023]MDO6563471.1 DNA topoisomerase I [Amphritea sp. 1_MG-2023]
MLQDNLIFLFSLIAVGFVALLVNNFFSTREQQHEYRQKRLKELNKKSAEALESLAVLREANCRTEITDALSGFVVSMIEEISALAPESELLQDIGAQKENTDRITAVPGGFNNDRALKKAQIHIQHAEKMCIEMAQLNKLSVARAKQFQHDLYWLHVCVFADAHINQGNDYLARGDKLVAMSHYKHAKAMVARANVPQKQKQDYIEKIRDLLNRARPSSAMATGNLAASIDLMSQKENKEE